MVRVVPQPPRTRTESLDAIVEVGQYDRVMAGVAAGRLQVEPRSADRADRNQSELGESHQGHLLGELIERRSPKANTEIP